MVMLLVAEGDAFASRDLATLYDTRTLHSVQTVCAQNLKKVLMNILNEGMQVVVPAESARWNDELYTVAAILEQLHAAPIPVEHYVLSMNANPSALAGQPRLPVAGGNAHQNA
jgi:hypothetical protein